MKRGKWSNSLTGGSSRKPITVLCHPRQETLLDVPFCSRDWRCHKKTKIWWVCRSQLATIWTPQAWWWSTQNLDPTSLQCSCGIESVPDSWKLGIVMPIYKGGAKILSTPTATVAYWGITLTQALAKVLSLILNCLWDVLLKKGIPHLNQTGYQRKIFATMEAVSQFA